MPSLFKTMEFQLKTERLDLSMWEESDSVWMRKLIGERGVTCRPSTPFVTGLLRCVRRQMKMAFPFSLFEEETKAISSDTAA